MTDQPTVASPPHLVVTSSLTWRGTHYPQGTRITDPETVAELRSSEAQAHVVATADRSV